jgi:peptide/nickel transport system permease protein
MTRHYLEAIGVVTLAGIALAGLMAPWLAPHDPNTRYPELLHTPPSRIRLVDAQGQWRAPFIYSWTRVSQLEQRYEENRSETVGVDWVSGGRLLQSADERRAPLMLFGTDSFGRDVFARLLYGGRTSLALAVAASEFVLVLPTMYVALALRAVMPLVLPAQTVFLLLTLIFAVVGAPFISRGVRGIVRSERRLDYAAAAASLGASPIRIIGRHLLPAARGFVTAQLTMLIPAFIVSEATLSFVGLGFPPDVPSWGTMLQEASAIRAIADFPWLLTPAAAIFLVVFALNLTLQGRPAHLPYDRPM